MSKKRVEDYISKALSVVENTFSSNVIPKEYNGYISSFGAGLVQSGLKPTVAIYENESNKDKTQQDRAQLPKMILQVIAPDTNENSLLRYIINSNEDENLLKEKIKDASIAIKLTMRTFNLKGKNNE